MNNDIRVKNFVVIPDEIYLDKDLSHTAVLLFGLIQKYMKKGSGCCVMNRVFAKKLNISEVTVSRNLSNLINKGFIYTESNNSFNRVIKIPDKYRLRAAAFRKMDTNNADNNSEHIEVINIVKEL